MQRLEVSGAVRPIYGSLGFKRLICSIIIIIIIITIIIIIIIIIITITFMQDIYNYISETNHVSGVQT